MIAVQFFVGRAWGVGAATILGIFAVALIATFALTDMLGAPVWAPPGVSAPDRFGYDAGTIVSAMAAAGFLFRQIRKDIATFIPIEPDHPVHLMALILATLLLGIDVTALFFAEVLSGKNLPALGVLDLFENELPFLVIALVGVGIFIRRSAGATMERLGLVVPAWWHMGLALAAAGALFALSQGTDQLNHLVLPAYAHEVDTTAQRIFGQLNNPVGIVALALLPGLCEDILFRGALQPRLGLVLTALLFTSIHTEYGLSLDTLAVLIAAVSLGLVRKYANTTASVACHTSYNLLVGIGLTGAALNAAVVIEVVLIAATAYAIWIRRRARIASP